MPEQTDRPKFRHLAIALGVLAALFLIGCWNLPLEATQCPNGTNYSGGTQQHCPQDQIPTLGFLVKSFAADLWDIGATHHGFEFLIAAFTFLLAVFTGTLWLTTLKIVGAAPQIERAYVSGGGAPVVVRLINAPTGIATRMASAGLPNQPTAVPTGDFQLQINNHGKTPGELLGYRIGFCDASAIPTAPQYTRNTYFYDWIGPATQSRPVDNFPIQLQQGYQRPCIYGRLYYRDIFGKGYSSGFILEIPEGKPILAPRAYTEECDESEGEFRAQGFAP